MKDNLFIFAVFVIIIAIFYILFRQRVLYNTVPRKIWTYWDNSDNPIKPLPKVVKMCMESWKKYNPDYEIILLTKKNFKGYVTIPEDILQHPHFHDSPQRFADLVRLCALEEHGGIWIDGSVLVKESFDNWLFPRYAEFAGYYMGSYSINKETPVIENWFLAANKNSQFIKLWKKEFLEIARFNEIQQYLESRKRMGVNFEKMRDPFYLAAYVAALKVIQIDKYPQDRLILRNSEEGPFKYLVDTMWYPEKALNLACSDKKYQSPLLKMRSDERNILEKEIDYELSPDKCGWLD